MPKEIQKMVLAVLIFSEGFGTDHLTRYVFSRLQFHSLHLLSVYVDASEACNILAFQLSGDAKRSWEIKVVQLKCDFRSVHVFTEQF